MLVLKVSRPLVHAGDQSDSDAEAVPDVSPPLEALSFCRERPAPNPAPTTGTLATGALLETFSVVRPPPPASCPPPLSPCTGVDNIPLQAQPHRRTITTGQMASAMPLIVACINMAVTMMHMHMTTTDAIRTQRAHKKGQNEELSARGLEHNKA